MSEDTYDPDKLVGTVEAARAAHRSPATIRSWAFRGHLVEAGRTEARGAGKGGRPLYRLGDVLDTERAVRQRDDTEKALAATEVHQPAHSA